VPGICLCAHSPSFLCIERSANRPLIAKMINASGKGCAEAPETRAFADQCRKKLVLSRTNALHLRAFADLWFVLSRTYSLKTSLDAESTVRRLPVSTSAP
jgi:hypothetical protein